MVVEKGKLAMRILVNVIVAGIIFSIANSIIASIGTAGGAIVSSIVSLVVLLMVVPYIMEKHPGEETLMSLILALPVGFALITLVNTLIGITLPALPVDAFVIGSMSMVLALASYFVADMLYLAVVKK